MNPELCCSRCGCTEADACVSEGVSCHWVIAPSDKMPGVCSECATPEDYALAEIIQAGRAKPWPHPAPRFHRRYS